MACCRRCKHVDYHRNDVSGDCLNVPLNVKQREFRMSFALISFDGGAFDADIYLASESFVTVLTFMRAYP